MKFVFQPDIGDFVKWENQVHRKRCGQNRVEVESYASRGKGVFVGMTRLFSGRRTWYGEGFSWTAEKSHEVAIVRRGLFNKEEFVFLDVQGDVPKAKAREMDMKMFNANHVSLFLCRVRMRRTRKRVRQTNTSQTATGWEYFNP